MLLYVTTIDDHIDVNYEAPKIAVSDVVARVILRRTVMRLLLDDRLSVEGVFDVVEIVIMRIDAMHEPTCMVMTCRLTTTTMMTTTTTKHSTIFLMHVHQHFSTLTVGRTINAGPIESKIDIRNLRIIHKDRSQ